MNEVGGYRIDLEDRERLRATATPVGWRLSDFRLPDRVDPRRHEAFARNWLQTENQGSIGSCQGNALTECLEYSYFIDTGNIIQNSRMFAYLMSQKPDGITSDQGSTLSGGTICVEKNGICLESIAPYPGSYPGHGWIKQPMIDDAANYKLGSHADIRATKEVINYIGAGAGIVQIGIFWNNSMEPDSNGCIRQWRSGGGGHSVTFCGYLPDEDVGVKSSLGVWLLLKNSWGTRWGKGGFAYVDTAAVDQMLRDQFTVFIGRSGSSNPGPQPDKIIDFTKKQYFPIG